MTILVALLVIGAMGFSQNKQWPHTFLWRISGNGLSKPSYLFGTIHLSDKNLFYFGDSLYHYFEQAESFNIEVDADSLINASVRKWSQDYNGRLLKSLMNRKEYDKYAAKLAKTIGKPADKITTKDIWLAKNRKTAEAYKKGNMQTFMDLYLYGIAKKQGKKVGGIEDIEDQMSIIDDLFDEMDVAYVASDTLQQTGMSMVDRMKEVYLRQDLDGVESLAEGSVGLKFRDIVLIKRNAKMARRMDSLARQRSSFFAVGVAHLPGDSGVIDLLRKRGFAVEPVFSSKKIAPENYTYKTIETPWVSYTHDLHLYHVEVPGPLQPMSINQEVMDMEYYYNLSDGKVYYTAVVNSIADPGKKDSIFSAMTGGIIAQGNSTMVSQKNIQKQGFDGCELVLKLTDGKLMHLQMFLAGGYAYMAMVMLGKAELNDKDMKRFFDSFSMTPSAPISKPYIPFSDTTMAFSIMLPHDPVINQRTDAPDEEDNFTLVSATDFSSGNSYAVTIRNTQAGKYIPDDSSYFLRMKTSLLGSMKEDTVVDMTTYKGYPAMYMNGSAKTGNVYYKTLTVLRGNRSYFVIAQVKKTTGVPVALADSFLHSFTMIPYSSSEWKYQTASDSSFTGWLPAPVKNRDEELLVDTAADIIDSVVTAPYEKETATNEFLFYDKATGTSYNVQREELSHYYFTRNDSTLFYDAGLGYKAEQDSIVSFSLRSVNKDKAADMQIDIPGSSIIKKLRFILHGDTLYKVITYTPRWLAGSENTQQFFNRFAITSKAPPTTFFTNKTGKLIADLTSSDSAVFEKASEYIYNPVLYKADLPAFYPLLIKPLQDFAESSYNTNNKLVEAIAKIADSSTVDFIAAQYPLLKGDQKRLQYQLLKLLVIMKQSYATECVMKLLHAQGAPGGDAAIFTITLYSQLPVANMLFPVIMPFTTDTAVAMNFAYVVTRLLDSNYISRQDVLPYLENFIAAAAQQKKKIKTPSDDYDYSLTELLDLFGTLNNTATNAKLQEYARVNNNDIRYTAVTWLIKNKQPLPADAINKLAASDAYRTAIYDSLKSLHKTAMFPAAQLTQKLFAASYVYSYATEDDDPPDVIKLVTEKIVTYNGTRQKFYLFRVSYGKGDDATHSLGIAGPFPLNSSQVTSTNDATGMYWKEDFDAKEINTQFNQYIKSLGAKDE